MRATGVPRSFVVFAAMLAFIATALAAVPGVSQDSSATDSAEDGPRELDAPTVDPALVSLRQQLILLMDGSLPEEFQMTGLFGVALDDLDQVSRRVRELGSQVDESESRRSEIRSQLVEIDTQEAADESPVRPPAVEAVARERSAATGSESQPSSAEKTESESGSAEETAAIEEEARRIADVDRLRREAEESEAAFAVQLAKWETRAEERARRRSNLERQLPSIELRLQISELRLGYLESLETRLGQMTDASRRILPMLAKPRAALRSHAEGLSAIAVSASQLSDRMEVLSERSAAGMIVGFLSEQRAIAAELRSGASAHRQLVERIVSLSEDLFALADALESEGRRVRAVFFRSVALDDSQALMDELFDSHLKAKRRLRKRVGDAFASGGSDSFEALTREAESIAPYPLQIGTTVDARRVLDAAVEYRIELDAVAAEEASSVSAWELAFENELMTVLSEIASEESRARGYAFSREILDDVASEANIAWSRSIEGFREGRTAFPDLTTLATSTRGQGILLRLGGVLALVGAWLFVRRSTPKLTVDLVRSLSRMPYMRRRIGLLVRGSGLLQAILPSVLALIALYLALLLLGPETTVAHIVRILLLPWILYVLGRQLLIGTTRRVTTGRPALIALRPDTRQRLQRTYANLGVVVAIAYALDGLARVAIGAGRVVSLLDSVVLVWLFVWLLWETIRWRVPLAQAWGALLPDADPEPFERRVASWMETSRIGFTLSPFALFRIMATPIISLFTEMATETDLVQSLRAKLLRRRSPQVDSKSASAPNGLPEEYLAGFPLYPILGEDDSLLVSRGSMLEDVTDQWKRWQESRTEGSLALIGEKGAGKTTLAAQVALRVGTMPVVQHTIRGKPKGESDLVADLSQVLGVEGAKTVAELAELICAGEERVIIVDEVHNVFLRHVDGYRAYDALVDVVNLTTDKVFWILIFNSFTWQFLNQSRGRVHYFRKLLHLPKWTSEEIEKLIRLRNKKVGFELRFDEVLLSDSRSDGHNISLVEEADGYFRLLWESSGGNPRIATHLWLASLRLIGDKTLGVGLFPSPSTEVLSELQDELVFCLAAICQHENLSQRELATVLNMSEGFARFAMQFLLESKFIEPKDADGERFTLSPTYYRAVLRALRNRHLLFE